MNIQPVSFLGIDKQNRKIVKNEKNKGIEEPLTAKGEELLSAKEQAYLKVQANNILKTAHALHHTVKYMKNEAKGVLLNSKQCQIQADEIFSMVQEEIENMESRSRHFDDYECVVLNLDSDDDEIAQALIQDGKVNVFKASSLNALEYDKYIFDLKTGELLRCQKGCRAYSQKGSPLEVGLAYVTDGVAQAHSIKEDYGFKNGKLSSYNAGVVTRDFVTVAKSLFFADGKLTDVAQGIKRSFSGDKKFYESKFFFDDNGDLKSYTRKEQISVNKALNSVSTEYEHQYQFDDNENLARFTRGYKHVMTYFNNCNTTYDEIFKYENGEIKTIEYDNLAGSMLDGSISKKTYKFADGKVYAHQG